MLRRTFIKLLGLTACNKEMILPQQIASGTVIPTMTMLIVAGQSNAEKGALFVSTDLPGTHDGSFPEVQYYGEDGVFRSLDSTDQDAYQSPVLTGDPIADDRFAFQFPLYPALAAQMGLTSANPLIVCSVSIGDTDMATEWNPNTPGTLFQDLVDRVNACRALVISTYAHDVGPVYCLWDQGEKDGRDLTKANAYEARIFDFVDFLRAQTDLPNIRFIMPLLTQASINGSPNDVPFGNIVNNDKRNQLADARTITVDCNDCEPSGDGVHFTWAGQLRKADLVRQAMVDRGWIPGTPTVIPTNQSVFTGYSTYVHFGDILDSLFAAVDAVFRIGMTVFMPSRYGFRTLCCKFNTESGTNNRTFHFLTNGDLIQFNYYRTGQATQARGITWSGMLGVLYDGAEHTIELRYNGAVDTNNGLDRPDLYIDGSIYTTGKTLAVNAGTLGDMFSSNAYLAVGGLVDATGDRYSNNFWYDGYMREFFIQNGSAVDQIRVVNLLTGTDTSGNGNNGTYVLG